MGAENSLVLRNATRRKGLNPRQNGLILSLSARRIGLAIARRLAQDGAHVVISSRKQQNVDQAVTMLRKEGLSVTGTVCHVGKAEDRERLVATVRGKEGNTPQEAGILPLGTTFGKRAKGT